MIDFNKMPCIYWSDSTKISYLQRRIIVYSIMYYEQNESCVSDKYYDSISRQLVELQRTCDPAEFRRSTYYYAMYDFDGSTGFDIPSRLTEYDRKYLTNIASHVYKQWKGGRQMLKLKDLDNRVYSGKICSEFSYILKDDKGKPKFRANFARGQEENEWQMRIVLDRTRDADSQVYTFRYIMPKSNLPLELIAATGLKYFQLYLKEEIQTKSEYDFMLGDVLKGM